MCLRSLKKHKLNQNYKQKYARLELVSWHYQNPYKKQPRLDSQCYHKKRAVKVKNSQVFVNKS